MNFSTSAVGTSLTYAWRKGSVNLVNGSNISGANSAVLSINPVNSSDAASDYNVLISGSCLPIVNSTDAALIAYDYNSSGGNGLTAWSSVTSVVSTCELK